MPFVNKAVGNVIYVWSEGGKKPPRYARGCVISAHGGQAEGYKTFSVPDRTKLFFYTPEGGILKADLVPMSRGKYEAFEVVKGGQRCRDYSLSKFQGAKHGGGQEDYEYIRTKMHAGYMAAVMKQSGFKQSDIDGVLQDDVKMDVVTIRNRRFHSDPTLSEVIDALEANGYFYREIHCSFCRYASAIGSSPGPNENVANFDNLASFTPKVKA
jgi:hypothetical protein